MAHLIDVRSARHGRLDLLSLSSSRFDPKRPTRRVPISALLGNSNLQLCSFVEAELRVTIILLLVALPWSISAQAGKDEKLDEVIGKLRVCARMYAPSVQGMQSPRNAIDILMEPCSPPPRLRDLDNPEVSPGPKPGAVLPSDLADLGAVSPGLFRHIISEEWASFLDHARTR